MKGNLEKRGDRFRMRVTVGYNEKGNPIRVSEYAKAKSKREAEKELALFIARIESGEHVKPDKTLLKDFVDDWLEKYAKKNIEYNTYSGYLNILKKRILPKYGGMKISDIKTMHIVDFVNELQKPNAKLDGSGPLAVSSIWNCYKAFNSVMKCAKNWGLISKNPCEGVQVAKGNIRSQTTDVYTVEDLNILYDKLDSEPLDKQILVILAVTTGAREAEIAALEWKHIDFENHEVLFEQTLYEETGKGVQIKDSTKTKRDRIVNLSDSIIPLLKMYKVDWEETKELAGELREYKDHDFIFCNGVTGKPIRPDSISQWWSRFLQRTGIKKKIRFHDLRHTSATLLINAGVHETVVQKRLGHSNISTTLNIYNHVLREQNKSAANVFDSILSKKDSAPNSTPKNIK